MRFYTFAIIFIIGCWNINWRCEASTEYNRYLAHIFRKYGNGGTMSFEGLEHLMYNLGLGQIEFDPTHTIDEHRPNGVSPVNGAPTTTDQDPAIKSFFDKQTRTLLPNEEDDMELKNAKEKPMTLPTALRRNMQDETVTDVVVGKEASDINVREKHIIYEFREMHDPKHRHPREHEFPFSGQAQSLNGCLSPKALMKLVVNHDDLHKRKMYSIFTSTGSNKNELEGGGGGGGIESVHDSDAEYNEFINNAKLTPAAFMKLCPALLSQIDQDVCVRPAPLTQADNPKENTWKTWLYATASILFLSVCGLIGIFLAPLKKSTAYEKTLKFLVAVAVGTLCGDALMHLLPHALFNNHSSSDGGGGGGVNPSHAGEATHSHDNTSVWICACAFATAVFMFILEHLLPLLRGNGAGVGHGHSHGAKGHAHTQQLPAATGIPAQKSQELPTKEASKMSQSQSSSVVEIKEINTMLDELKKDTKAPSKPMTSVAFMVILGDGLHNLTDGLAIGAAFASDTVTGFATAFAVLCHEVPHELGDFALLLQTGMSMKRAAFMNLISSVLSLVGMAIGMVIAGKHSTASQYIYGSTAGSFLYIAMADLIPAMRGAEGETSLSDVLIQILGIVVGGIIMLVIAVKEEALEELFK